MNKSIVECLSCATRTRNYIGQPKQLEISNDVANSITTVAKDSMVLEIYETCIKSKERNEERLP